MSPIMVINIAHHPTDCGPDWYRRSCRPRPTSFLGFSGMTAVPVHSQARMQASAAAALANVSIHQW